MMETVTMMSGCRTSDLAGLRFTRRRAGKAVVPLLLAALIGATAAECAEIGDVKTRIATLEKLAAEVKANRDKIATWSGEYAFGDKYFINKKGISELKIEDKVSEKGPWLRQDVGIVRFVLSAPDNSLYTSISTERSTLIRDGEKNSIDIPLPNCLPQESIVTSDKYYFFHPGLQYGQFERLPRDRVEPEPAVFRDPMQKAQELKDSVVVDPRNLLGYARPFSEELETAVYLLRELGSKPLPNGMNAARVVRIVESGAGEQQKYVISISLTRNPQEDLSKAMQFQLVLEAKNGYNFTDVTVKTPDGRVTQTMNWEYQKRDGIFLPGKVVRMNIGGDGTTIANERVYTLKSCQLNAPISASAFTIGQFGVKDGTRVMDRVEEVCYRYRNGELVDPVRFLRPGEGPGDSVPVEGGSRGWRLIAGLIGLAAVAVVAVLLRRAKGRSAPQ